MLVGFFAPCGVAKAGVATLPMIGAITRGLQFLFVTRSGTTGKAPRLPHCRNHHITLAVHAVVRSASDAS